MRTISDDRMSLVPQIGAHADQMYAILSDPLIYTHLDDGPPESLDWLKNRFERLETRQSPDGDELWLNWVIELKSGQPVGYVQASVEDIDCGYIGYVIGAQFWGQGIGTRATKLMIEELTKNYGVRRLLATVEPENHASIALLKRLSFSKIDNPDDSEFLFEKQV